MNIRKKFIELTKHTYPYGYEDELVNFLPESIQKDEDENYFLKIGESKTIFTCHLDTACKTKVEVTHVFDGGYIKTDGKSILGADDKAGMVILLNMIEHKVPGLYYFFIGEEVGCIGSRKASLRTSFFQNYDRIISFDRRGTTSVITHQSSRRTCSDSFANALSAEFSKRGIWVKPDDTGVYTDSAEFASVIKECTNISVGYGKEHTNQEYQDIDYLERLCAAVLKIDFESLPTSRNEKLYEYKSWGGAYGGYYGNNDYWYDTSGFSEEHRIRRNGEEYRSKKRNRSRRGKAYYDSSDGLHYGYTDTQPDFYYVDGRKVYYNKKDAKPFGLPAVSDHYSAVRDMYLDPDLTKEELDVIKKDFLDKNSSEDQMFSNYMSEVF